MEAERGALQRIGDSSEAHLSEGSCTRPDARGSCSLAASYDLMGSFLYSSSQRSRAETRRRSDYARSTFVVVSEVEGDLAEVFGAEGVEDLALALRIVTDVAA